jgi:hypothetical protein
MQKIIVQFFIIIMLSLVSCNGGHGNYYEFEYASVQIEYIEYIEAEVAEIPNFTNSPDRTFVEKIHNPDNPMIAILDMWWDEDVPYTERWWGTYDVAITIQTPCGEVIQEITGLSVSPILRSFIPIDYENPFNFHFADYNADGFLDMGLRLWAGGSMRNDPHSFWLWDDETGQFIRHYELQEWSYTASVWEDADSWLGSAGNIHAFTRITFGHYFWETAAFIDNELTNIQTREHRTIFDCNDYLAKITTTNHITGEKTIEFIPREYEYQILLFN